MFFFWCCVILRRGFAFARRRFLCWRIFLDDGFCFSRWTATISLQDPQDSSVIFSELFTAKGFGPDEKRAAMDAQRKLRLEAFLKFATLARDKFDMSMEEY